MTRRTSKHKPSIRDSMSLVVRDARSVIFHSNNACSRQMVHKIFGEKEQYKGSLTDKGGFFFRTESPASSVVLRNIARKDKIVTTSNHVGSNKRLGTYNHISEHPLRVIG